jgi:hypothetical protein
MTMVTILWYVWLLAAGTVALFLFRNVWLFNRLCTLDSEESVSIKLTYTQMLLRFWVWNVRKFLPRQG